MPFVSATARMLCIATIGLLGASSLSVAEPIDLGTRRELFVDHHLIDKLQGVRLRMHEPRDEGAVLAFDEPWEGGFSGYVTVVRDGDRYRAYYRGWPKVGQDGQGEVTCYAESADGMKWTKPRLGLFEVLGTKDNNVILAGIPGVSHNFAPFIDTRPGVAADQRYKALGGTVRTGLMAFVSGDGTRWRKLREEAVIPKAMVDFPSMFDSQNVAFWSETEGRYVSYFRVFKDKIRRVAWAASDDFVNWSNVQLMAYRAADGSPAPIEHVYTNQTHPYFRAPHIYVAIAARFMPNRQVLSPDEAKAIGVEARYFKDTSDAILMTHRPGSGPVYDRTFLSAFVRPGIGHRNWTSRTNYPAPCIVQTGEHEMSIYINQDYAQPTAHLRRYSMRLDGLASARAEYSGGELITKPLRFAGKELRMNFATSAAGGIRVEIQDEAGRPIPGFALGDAVESIGNEIDRAARWKSGADVSALAGRTVRLRFVIKDADLYAIRFAAMKGSSPSGGGH